MTPKNEKIDYKNYRFEFLLSVNGNIICQRLFDIRDYNEKVLEHPHEVMWLLDDCVNLIQEDLKEKTIDQMWKYFNPYVKQTQEDVDKTRNSNDKKHTFEFQIRVDKKTIVKREFSGNVYLPNVRYQVNIKGVINDIIYKIRSVLSQKKFGEYIVESENN